MKLKRYTWPSYLLDAYPLNAIEMLSEPVLAWTCPVLSVPHIRPLIVPSVQLIGKHVAQLGNAPSMYRLIETVSRAVKRLLCERPEPSCMTMPFVPTPALLFIQRITCKAPAANESVPPSL